ncbi:SIMPL domain-containing protein [Actinoplanes sp. NPDC089786]|uniref:SIMPL domain-containing protein n=1 Tax=Actinoplanes sp. NPDC089786 TaxID=3155185 RepID=UPI00343F7A6C
MAERAGDQATVTVRGEAMREVPPEQAVVSVTVSARESSREVVLQRLTERAAELRSYLDDVGEAIERRESGSVQIHPELKRGGGKVVAFQGAATTTVTVTDFAALGDLLLRLGRLESASVSGPWWQLKPGSRAGADVRAEAVADALQRAREYAAAVGARVDRLVEIADEGAGGVQPMMHRSLAFAAKAESADLELELDPAVQTVQASVVVRVTITEPTAVHTEPVSD